jgi:hypothetical protein
VTELLRAAFDHDVRTRPVDEHRLTTGTRVRLRHRRRVRRVQVAATALAVAASVAAAVSLWPGTTPAVSTTPVAQSPSESPAGEARIDVVAYDLPDMSRARAVLPGGGSLTNLDGVANQYRAETPLAGPVGCGGEPGGNLAVQDWSIAGRQFQWTDDTVAEREDTLLVSGWPTGTGADVFRAATDGSLPCAMSGQLSPVDLAVPVAEQTWAVVADLGGPPAYLTGSVRVGDLIVSASLPAATPTAATARSGELSAVLRAAVDDLRAGDLPAVDGR